MLFIGEKIENGTIKWNNKKVLEDFVKTLPNGKVEMNIKRYRKKRSNPQNALMWIWLEYISEHTGYDKDELHITFRSMFLTDKTQKIPLVRSTTALNTLEFMTYLRKIEQVATELDIILPNPEDYWTEQEIKTYKSI